MSGRPRTTSFAEGNKSSNYPVMGGMKIISKYMNKFFCPGIEKFFHTPAVHSFALIWRPFFLAQNGVQVILIFAQISMISLCHKPFSCDNYIDSFMIDRVADKLSSKRHRLCDKFDFFLIVLHSVLEKLTRKIVFTQLKCITNGIINGQLTNCL